jgi:hypothetical protein
MRISLHDFSDGYCCKNCGLSLREYTVARLKPECSPVSTKEENELLKENGEQIPDCLKERCLKLLEENKEKIVDLLTKQFMKEGFENDLKENKTPGIPNHLWRRYDGERFTRNEDGTYSMDSSNASRPLNYDYSKLMGSSSFSITKPEENIGLEKKRGTGISWFWIATGGVNTINEKLKDMGLTADDVISIGCDATGDGFWVWYRENFTTENPEKKD